MPRNKSRVAASSRHEREMAKLMKRIQQLEQEKKERKPKNSKRRKNGKSGQASFETLQGAKERSIAAVQKDKKIPKSIATDLRFSPAVKSASDNQQMVNVSPAITYVVPNTALAICAPAVAVVSFAVERGFQEFSINDSVPSWALIYLSQVLINYTQNTVPMTTDIPLWLAILGQALVPCTVPTRTGKVTYKWELDTLDATTLYPSGTVQMGPLAYSKAWNIGVIGDTTVNGNFFEINPPLAYSTANGQAAFESLMSFLASYADGQNLENLKKMMKRVPSNASNAYSLDVSCFAVNSPQAGGGFANAGGWNTEIKSEVPVATPLLAGVKSKSSTTGQDTQRGPLFSHFFAGDGLFLGGMLVGMLSPKQVRFRIPPVFHGYDLLEFVDTLCKAVTLATQEIVDDPAFPAEIEANPGLVDTIKFPFTLQEIALMMRATIMTAFKDTQFMVQGLYEILPSDVNDNQFVPLVSGFGTCSLPGTSDMLLPMLLAENIRSSTYRSNNGYKGGESNPKFVIPVLGKYHADTLDLESYSVFYKNAAGDVVTIPMFLDPADGMFVDQKHKRRSVGKGSVGVEAPIDLIDGKTGSTFVAINDPGALSGLITAWNQRITAISSHFTQLTTVGTEGGVPLLTTGIGTRNWVPVGGEDQEGVLSTGGPRKRTLTDRIVKEKPKRLGTSPYVLRQIAGHTFNTPPFASPWETIQQNFIFPVCLIQSSSIVEASTTFQRTASLQQEPYQMSEVESAAALSLDESHAKFATMMIKGKFAAESEVDAFFRQAAEKGQGGILSSLAASFGHAAVAIGADALEKYVPY